MRGKTRQKAKEHVINMGAKILNKIQPNKIQKYEKSKKYSACWGLHGQHLQRILYLNIRAPDGGTLWGGCGILRRWSPAGGSGL